MNNNNIWFLTDSWLNIVYDVCCCTWVCFYSYMVNLGNSRASYVSLWNRQLYKIISVPFCFYFPFLGGPLFLFLMMILFPMFLSSYLFLGLCFLFHYGQIFVFFFITEDLCFLFHYGQIFFSFSLQSIIKLLLFVSSF